MANKRRGAEPKPGDAFRATADEYEAWAARYRAQAEAAGPVMADALRAQADQYERRARHYRAMADQAAAGR